MSKLNYKKGFTLIELLVVVAIIGILSSVVLASLNSARKNANAASIQANLNTIKKQAELYYDTKGHYGQGFHISGSCPPVYNTNGQGMFYADKVINDSLQQIVGKLPSDSINYIKCIVADPGYPRPTTSEWAIAVNLQNGKTWCVDSSGASGYTILSPGADFGKPYLTSTFVNYNANLFPLIMNLSGMTHLTARCK
ncbi:MAG: type II secretion system GspH family protein [Candidatus Pacebacteria bacterium]|nr:type II secretion system GspH family protein [Candidatus Paceibacterota bacterium]MCF7862555.1 type II secretion system GspH family protein [Candidatus Paceibacterota bacterium]